MESGTETFDLDVEDVGEMSWEDLVDQMSGEAKGFANQCSSGGTSYHSCTYGGTDATFGGSVTGASGTL